METYKETIRQKANQICEELKKAGVEFNRDEFWAEYIHLGDGHNYKMCNINDVDGAIQDAKDYIAEGNAENITEALQIICDEEKPEIEICVNNEWLRVYGGYEPEEDTGNDEIAEEKWQIDKDAFYAVFSDSAEFVDAKHQRIMCHGWNGAGFTHRNGGHATFCVLTEKGEKEFDSI